MNDGGRVEMESNLSQEIRRIDRSLDVMESYGQELSMAESQIQQEMRRWDRKFKDQHLHSTPRPRKHQR